MRTGAEEGSDRRKAGRGMWLLPAAMVAGLSGGLLGHAFFPELVPIMTGAADLVTGLFLRLIRMIIAPLVLASLAGGIGSLGSRDRHEGEGRFGRMVVLAMLWFFTASAVSLLTGLVSADILRPGVLLGTPDHQAAGIATDYHFDATAFLSHIIPVSVIDAMGRNDILQVVVFSVFFGLAMSQIRDPRVDILRDALSGLTKVMLRVTDYVMMFAPVAVFAALLSVTARGGVMAFFKSAGFIGLFWLICLLFCVGLLLIGFCFLGRQGIPLFRRLFSPTMLGFATASSEATFPLMMEQLQLSGVPARQSAFILPLGYSFNMDGSMLFQSFTAIAIAQACGMEMSWTTQLGMLGMMMISSKGVAGVPRASLIALTTVMPGFGIPESGIALVLGIDHFLDMARTGVTVLGNGIACAVVARFSGQIPAPALVAEQKGNA